MINFLPPIDKREIQAGRTNRLLLRYLILFAALMLALLMAIGFAYIYLLNTKNNAEAKIRQNEEDSKSLAAKKQEVDAFKTNLATAKQIIDKQVDYTTILLRISDAIPSGVVLSDLSIDPATFGTPGTLNARATSEASALRLKDALESSKYFTDVQFDSITKADVEDRYNYQLVMTVTMTPELLQ